MEIIDEIRILNQMGDLYIKGPGRRIPIIQGWDVEMVLGHQKKRYSTRRNTKHEAVRNVYDWARDELWKVCEGEC